VPGDAETLDRLEASAHAELARAGTLPELQEVRARLLGRKGSVSALLRSQFPPPPPFPRWRAP
jgi:hypothetical protein